MEFTVVHPGALHRCKPGLHWVYADEKLELYGRVAAAFSGIPALVSPREFQQVVSDSRSAFINWVDGNLKGAAAEEWILTPLHKNPFSNNLLLHLVWLTLLAERSSGKDRVVVVTESRGLLRTLRLFCAARGLTFSSAGNGYFAFDRGRASLKGVLRLGYDVVQAFWRKAAARSYFNSNYLRGLVGIELLLDSFLTDRDVSDSGEYRNSYFPGLLAWYRKRGIRAAHYPILYEATLARLGRLYRRMSRSEERFVLFERFIKVSDVIKAARRCLRSAFSHGSRSVTSFRGLDVNPLVQELRFSAAVVGLFPLLLMKAPARLAAHGIAPKWVIDWFENQPVDKANCVGFKNAPFPCRVVGVRQYLLSPNFTNLFSTSEEVAAGVNPKEQWVCGEALIGAARTFDGMGEYRVVPALRYVHLHAKNGAERVERDLLVALTHSREESFGILELVVGILLEVGQFFEKVVVGSHPDSQIDEADIRRRWPSALLDRLVFSSQGMSGGFLTTAKILVTGGSSKGAEAICYGVPVIVIGRNAGLDINPLVGIDGRLWKLVYGLDELRCAMGGWLPAHPLPLEERLRIGREVRKGYFEPATEKAMESFDPDSTRAAHDRPNPRFRE